MKTRILPSLLAVTIAAVAHNGPSPHEFKPPIRGSEYRPVQTRDPFGDHYPSRPQTNGATTPSVDPIVVALRLEGVLFHPKTPEALINGQVVRVGRPTILRAGNVTVEVKATEIRHNSVKLEVNGQPMELKLPQP